MAIATVNPATGEVMQNFESLNADQIEREASIGRVCIQGAIGKHLLQNERGK